MTGGQVQEARRLLGWSSYRLAARCSVSAAVIRTFELTGRIPRAAPTVMDGAKVMDRAATIRGVLEAAGVEFMDAGAGGSTVRLKAEDA